MDAVERKVILTALKKYWELESPIIFAWDGCCRYSDKDELDNLDYVILQDFNQLEDHVIRREYLSKLQIDVCKALSRILNEIHGESHKFEYWYFITQVWVKNYLELWYIRYLEIKHVIQCNEGNPIKVLQVPYDQDSYIYKISYEGYSIELIKSDYASDILDLYYYIIHSRILKELQQKYEIKLIEEPLKYEYKDVQMLREEPESGFKNRIRAIELYLLRKSPILCISLPSGERSRWLKLKQLGKALFAPPLRMPSIDIQRNVELRKNIKLELEDENEFADIIAHNICFDMPLQWIESYKAIRKVAESEWKLSPKLVIAPQQMSDINALVGMASWYENGVKFCGEAHSLLESLEKGIFAPREITEIYYFWRKGNGIDSRQCPNYKTQVNIFNKLRSSKADREIDKILWCASAGKYEVRYNTYYSGFCRLTCEEKYSELKNILNFVYKLDDDRRRQLVYRSRDQSEWGAVEFWKERFPELKFENVGKVGYIGGVDIREFKYSLLNSKLVVCESLVSAVLGEIFAYNLPVIIISKDILSRIEDVLYEDVLDIYRELKKAGIWYEDGIEAAKFINNNYDRINEWWQEPARQNIRKRYLEDLFCTCDDVSAWWNQELNQLSKLYMLKK